MHIRFYAYGAVAFITVIALMMFAPRSVTPETPAAENTAATSTPGQSAAAPERQLQVFGSIPYWDQPRAIAVFKENVGVFDIISVFWYHFDDGAIRKYAYASEDASLIAFAHENDVKVLALIANLPEDDDWDADEVEEVIGSPAARATHIAEIRALVQSKGFDGVNIDYEMLRDDQTEDFSAFIRELGRALRADGKLLAVAIHAQEPGGETRGQDLVALQSADILSFMTYDQHWETGDAGPVASLSWVRDVLAHARELGVDMQKVFMGIPLYGYDWPQARRGWRDATGREYEDVVRIANEYDVEVVFDDEAQSPHFSYEADGVMREVWFENIRSFTPKYELAKEFGVGGVMFWRQGREDMRIYDVLKEE